MEIHETHDNAAAMEYAAGCLSRWHEGLDVFYNETTFLQTGVLETSDVAAAQAMGIPVWQAEHMGGSIVCFPGDLSLCLTTWGGSDFGERLFAATAEYLRGKGVEVTTDNNDVLVNGRKVMSWARGTTREGWCQTVAHYSVHIDLDIIRQICTKDMEKTPGALSTYNITADELFEDVVLPCINEEDGL